MHVQRLLFAFSVVGAFLAGCRTAHPSASANDEVALVRVIDTASGAPVSGARVYYVDDALLDVRARSVLAWAPISAEDVRDWMCSSVSTDAQGEARVPRSTPFVEATSGAKWGAADVAGERTDVAGERAGADRPDVVRDAKEPIVVRLASVHAKRARVVDADGKPVGGVLVLLLDASRGADLDASAADDLSGRPLWAGRSRLPDGIVEITPWRTIVGSLPGDTRLRMCVMLPDVGESERCSDVSRDESEVCTLTVRAPGSVIVNVRRSDGTPAPDRSLVELFAANQKPMNAADDEDGDDEAGFSEYELTSHGTVLFPAVSVGAKLTLTARAWDGSRRAQITVEGPRAAGEIVSVDLTLGERLPTLTGRLLDEHGAPFARGAFFVEWNTSAPRVGLDSDDTVTDARGRFRLDVDELPSATPGRDLELRFSSSDGLPDVAWPTARVRVKDALTPGDHDLGDIVLRAAHSAGDDTTSAP